jgi:hypothetical protein
MQSTVYEIFRLEGPTTKSSSSGTMLRFPIPSLPGVRLAVTRAKEKTILSFAIEEGSPSPGLRRGRGAKEYPLTDYAINVV